MTRNVILLFLLTMESSYVATQSPTVNTKHGPIQGSLVNLPYLQEVYQFTGIPFAEPPVGDRRFRKPVYKSPWNATLDGTKFPPACIQKMGSLPNVDNSSASGTCESPPSFGNPPDDFKGFNTSEDCLYLNIWVPRNVLDGLSSCLTSKTLPVYIYIYGGAFISGSTMSFNGSVLAAFGNIIVVTVAYRVGHLGFLYLGTDDAPGNQGLWDQQMGMRWIHENIGAFGGNDSAITIGGESAGSTSVALHLLAPSSRSYFQRAIMESGSATPPGMVITTEEAQQGSGRAIRQVASGKCASSKDQAACLRSASVEEILTLWDDREFRAVPVVDSDFLPKHPRQMVAQGDFADVPFLAGTNQDEASMFILIQPKALELVETAERFPYSVNMSLNDDLLESLINDLTGIYKPINQSFLETVNLLYWPSDRHYFPEGLMGVQSVIQAASDFEFKCPTFVLVKTAAQLAERKSPVFVYDYAHRSTRLPKPDWVGVSHGDELDFVFGAPLASETAQPPYSNYDKRFSEVMMIYWTNFIKTGNPNFGSDRSQGNARIAYWPNFTAKSSLMLVLDSQPFHVVSWNYKTRHCWFWDHTYPQLKADLHE